MTVAYSREPGPIALGDAIEWGHPDNTGLALSLVGLPGAIGNTWVDLTRKTAGATLVGGATWAGTPYGQAGLRIAGGTQWAQGGTAALQSGNRVTVATWVSPAVLSRGDIVTQWATGGDTQSLWNLLSGLAAGKPQFYVGTATGNFNSGTGAGTMVVGRCYRVVGTYDGATAAVYLDGQFQSSGAGVTTLPTTTTTPLRVGNNIVGDGQLNGSVAGVTILTGVAASPGWVARDFEWSQDPQRDPRFRRTSTRSLFVTAGGVPTTAYLPAVACGWGW